MVTATSHYGIMRTQHGYVQNWSAAPAPARQLKQTDRIALQIAEQSAASEAGLNRVLAQFTRTTTELRQALAGFSIPAQTSGSRVRTVDVSDPRKASAAAEPEAEVTAYSLEIDRLDCPKTLSSRVLASESPTELAEGTHAFTLTVGDTAYGLSITVSTSGSSPDTNRDVLENIAWAIASADSSIEAVVTEGTRPVYSSLSGNPSENVSRLVITAQDSDDTVDFSLSDSSPSSIITDLGLDRITTPPSRAHYALDGLPLQAEANTVLADQGRLMITLLETTVDRIALRVQAGAEPLYNTAVDLISQYNDYLGWLEQENRINPVVKNDLARAAAAHARDIAPIGLKVNDQGMIETTDLFKDSFTTQLPLVQNLLTGPEGLLTALAARLDTILANGAQAYAALGTQPQQYGSLSIFA
jgi:hypothetical protein